MLSFLLGAINEEPPCVAAPPAEAPCVVEAAQEQDAAAGCACRCVCECLGGSFSRARVCVAQQRRRRRARRTLAVRCAWMRNEGLTTCPTTPTHSTSKSVVMLRVLHIEGLPITITAARLSDLMSVYGPVQYAEVG